MTDTVESSFAGFSRSRTGVSAVTLDQLRIFLAVAELQHVTKAAEALNLAQSAVSTAIATLESDLGFRLFDRVGRNIRLNHAGAAFRKQALVFLSGFDDLRRWVADHKTASRAPARTLSQHQKSP